EGWRGHLTGGDDPAQAAKMYQDMLAYIPPGEEAAETYFSLAQALKSSGQNDKAAQAFSALMLSYPFSRWTARTLREEREFVSQAAAFTWGDVEQMSQIQRLSRAGSYQQVRDIAVEVAPKHPNDPLGENAAYALITSDVYLTSDFNGAIEQMQGYLDKYPNALRERDARRRIDIWREISGLLDDLADNPQDYPTHQQVGFSLLQSGFYNQAAEHFETVKAGSGAEDAYLGLGYTYMRLNRTPESIENFECYLKNHPDDGTIYNLIGYAYMGSGQLEKAEECFARYKDLEPNNPNSHDSYAECLMNSGKLDEAIAEYKEAIRLNPGFTNLYAMLGQIYIIKGEAQSAQEFFGKYLELDPNGVLSAQARAQLDSLEQQK
ncbi:MAG TPA: tetratricopeptide repeat protein, partial [bacterium]